MSQATCPRWQNAQELAIHLLESHQGQLTVAMPLGLGKANHLINALYKEVSAKPDYSLTIFTALSLQTPQPKPGLEKRFFDPIAKRLYANYTELLYARDLLADCLPSNVVVSEFFLQAGAYLNNQHAQSNYISANYSHVSSFLIDESIDVVIQMVAQQEKAKGQASLSLSCNPDITLELLMARNDGRAHFSLIGEINAELPYMPNDALVGESEFAHVLEGDCEQSALFNVPKQSVALVEYAAGFHASSLIKDGGTLQMGIGSVGDAVAHALIMRHRDNENYKCIVSALNHGRDTSHLHLEPFEHGLYGVSEMLVDVFLDLLEAGVIKREVDGILIQGGFFLGPRSMYQRLRDLPQEQLAKINMTHIGYINDTHTEFNKKQQNRQHARFVNNAMKATLLGAVVSDGLDNGQVVSGVGGQYDFVRQAFALPNAKSILMLKAVREKVNTRTSNIVWSYGHTTIPRHLRDIVVSEYGIADLRGARDSVVISNMLAICDAQFQAALLSVAKRNNKIPDTFVLKMSWAENTPAMLSTRMQPFFDQGLLPQYPFGSDFTEIEQILIPALQTLKSASISKLGLLKMVAGGLSKKVTNNESAAITRLQLENPKTLNEKLSKYALLGALRR